MPNDRRRRRAFCYKFDQGRVGPAVRIRALKGYDPRQIGIHPQGTRIATLGQASWSARDVITFWDLHPAPREVMEIRQPKGVDIGMYPLRYSADGSIIVVGGTPTLAIDAVTGKTRCAVSEPLRPTTHPNTQGLTAGIGWQMGELPRVVVWNSATCEIRSTLNPNM